MSVAYTRKIPDVSGKTCAVIKILATREGLKGSPFMRSAGSTTVTDPRSRLVSRVHSIGLIRIRRTPPFRMTHSTPLS